PRSDNPEVGFVGDVNGAWGNIPPNPYGVHAKPVAKLLREYGLDAKAHSGMSWKDIRLEIAAGRPVIVWLIGGVWAGTAEIYHAKDGSQVTVARFEHTMILIGYDQSVVHLVDAGSGYTLTHPVGNFRDSWSVLGNMAVTVQGTPQAPPSIPGESYVVQTGDYLTKLAEQWGIPWQDLAAYNNISYPYTIYPGQILLIPGAGTPIPTAAATATNAAPTTPAATEATAQATAAVSPSAPPAATPTATQTQAPTQAATPTHTPQASAVPQTGHKTHTVQRGEHLMQIARNLELDWRELAELNQLAPPYVVYPGDVLLLPIFESAAPPPTPAPTSTPLPQPSVPTVYNVQQGDYLVAIARKFGLDWLTLAAINDIYFPYIVFPGQVLLFP
ncbi:MAG: LysM peptidoglycan-binding domain-containing protein, partial [Anaerolineae bacterium]|nr:LysM peptidoglycan-binding domain-containing protein [Anaerolineae bacterium]